MNKDKFRASMLLILLGLVSNNDRYKVEVEICTTKTFSPFAFLEFIEGINLAEFRLKGEATNIPYYQVHQLYIDARQIEIAYINHLNRK